MNTDSKGDSDKDTELNKQIQSLVEKSRLGGVVIAVGVAILLGSVWFSSFRLSSLDKEIANRIQELKIAMGKKEEAETLAMQSEKRAEDLEGTLNNTRSELRDAEKKLAELNSERDALEQALSELRAIVGSLKPNSLTIYLATPNQEELAENIADNYVELGVPENRIRIVKKRQGDPPYATEVRYFNFPNDIELAQSICLRIQRDFKIIFSRISLVEDSRPQGTIEIHFNTSF